MSRPFSALLALTVIAACGGSGPTNPGNPGNQGGDGVAFSVDGGTFSSTTTHALFDGTSWVVGGSFALQSIALSWEGTGTGTYTVGTSADAIGVYGDGTGFWSARSSGGSGSVTVTSLTSSRIKGTFSFVMTPSGSNTGNKTISAGSFDLGY